MAVITTKQANGSFKDQLIDGTTGTSRKWFSLQKNILDGSFHPIPADGSEQVGFIGAYSSDTNGNILRPVILFNGSSTKVTIGNPPELQITGDQTIELILRPDSLDDRRNPFAKAYGGEGTITQEINGSFHYYYGTAGDNASPYQGVNSGFSLAVREKAHIAVVRDLTNMKIQWYKNGQLTNEVDAVYSSATASNLDVLIGAGYVSNYNGIIYEVRIWNIARAQEELQRDMYKPLSGNEAGLVGYWRLDEGSGSVAYDKTPNTNHGTIYGAAWTTVQAPTVIRINPVNKFPVSQSFEECSGEHVGNPNDPNSVRTSIGGGWFVATHYNSATIRVETDGGFHGTKRVSFIHDGSSGWKGLVTETECINVTKDKWYRVSVRARANQLSAAVFSNGYAFYDSDGQKVRFSWDVLPTQRPGEWVVGIAVFKATATAAGRMYLYGLTDGEAGLVLDYDGVLLEEFETEPTSEIQFGFGVDDDLTFSVHQLRIVGDNNVGAYPVDFDIQLYDKNANLLLERNVIGNDQVEWKEILPQVYDAAVVDILVHKVATASTPSVRLSEVGNLFEVVRSDAAKPKLTESLSLVAVGITDADNLLPLLTDVSSPITAQVPSSDSLPVRIDDSSFFRQLHYYANDELKPRIDDITASIIAQLLSNDDLKTRISETFKDIIAEFSKLDSLIVGRDIERVEITVELDSADTLLPAMSDMSTPTNVHTIMSAPERKIYGKVEITYSDPYLDESIQVTASGSVRYTDPAQTADSVVEPAYKWFSLHDNRLDGTYHPLPSDGSLSVGWWSDVVSDALGSFANPPELTVQFEPQPIFRLRVVGDSLLNNYPVDFTVELYDTNSTLLYAETVTGNTQVDWSKDISEVLDVAEMKLTISKINQSHQPAKIAEFYTAVKETYYDDDLEFIQLLEETHYRSGTISLGAVSSNEIDIGIDNIEGKFSLDNPQSPISNYIKRNRRVKAWLGVEVVEGQIEWYPLGVFWTTSWSIPDQSVMIGLTARDRLELMRNTMFETSQVYTNYTLKQLFELVLQDYGLTTEEYYVDNSLDSIIIPYAWIDKVSHREALQRLAGCAQVSVFCDREGRVVVTSMVPTDTVIYEFSEDVNVFNKNFPSLWLDIANYIEVISKTWGPGSSQVVLEDTEVFTVPAGTQVTKVYEFSRVPVVNVQAPVITGGANTVVDSYQAYAWGISITFRNDGASDEQVTSVSVTGDPLEVKSKHVATAKDDQLIREDGELRVRVEHDFIQSSSYAQQLANDLLNTYKVSRYDVVLESRGNIALDLLDKIKAPGPGSQTIHQYAVIRQDIKWAGSLEATVEGRRL